MRERAGWAGCQHGVSIILRRAASPAMAGLSGREVTKVTLARAASGAARSALAQPSFSTWRKASKHSGSIALPTVSAIISSVFGMGTAPR